MAILDLNENIKEKSNPIKSVCKMMELTILGGGGSKSNSMKIMDFTRLELNRLQELEGKVCWEVNLKDKGLQKSRQFLKETVSHRGKLS